MIEIVNFVLVVIIIISIVVNLILLHKARADLTKRINTTAAQMKTITPSGGAITILEFAEFEKLTPQVKDLYRKYIVSHLLPKTMEFANKELIDNKQIEEVKKTLDKLAVMSVQEMIQKYGPPKKANALGYTETGYLDKTRTSKSAREIPNHVSGAGLTTTDGLSPSQRFRKLGDFDEKTMKARYLLSSPQSNAAIELSEEEFNAIFMANDDLREWMAISWENAQKQMVTVFTYDIVKNSDMKIQPFDTRQSPNITNIIYNFNGNRYAMLRDTKFIMDYPR